MRNRTDPYSEYESPEHRERDAKRGGKVGGIHPRDVELSYDFTKPEPGSAGDALERARQAALGHLSQDDQDEIAQGMYDRETGSFTLELDSSGEDILIRVTKALMDKARELPARKAALKKASDTFDKEQRWRDIRGTMRNSVEAEPYKRSHRESD